MKARTVAPARRGRGTTAAGRARPHPQHERRWHDGLAALVEDQSDEIWGLAFVLLAVLAALGIYAALAGAVGRGVREGAGDLFGLARYVLPLGFLVLGGYLLSKRPRPQPGRVAIGLGAALLTLSGLFGVVGSRPTVHQPVVGLRSAGGWLGLVVEIPLRAGLGGWGAGLVLGVLLLVALLIVTATPVRAVGSGLRTAARAAGRAALWPVRVARVLLRAGEEREPGLALAGEGPLPPPRRSRAGFGWPALADEAEEAEEEAGGTYEEDEEGDELDELEDLEEAEGPVPSRGLEGRTPAGAAPRGGPERPGLKGPLPISGLGAAGKGEQLAMELAVPRQPSPPWRLPPMTLLKRSSNALVDRRQVEELGKTLEGALAAHGVETRLVGATVGPSVTRYELELGPGVKVQRVTALHRDIAYAMAATEVRILAPIPGRSAIGVEVPNRQRQVVTLGDILASPEAAAARHPLEVAAGRDIAGRPVLVNLAEMPHLLIAGATGSGKSSCLNAMLTSVLMRATPAQVRLILVDPKRVELGAYAGLPHLLTNVVTNPKKAANALRWAVEEMERRYDLLAEVGMRDITGYNAAYDRGDFAPEPPALATGAEDGEAMEEAGVPTLPGGPNELGRRYERLPFVLVVVDELNDLMMVAARDVEESICRIAQMARAVGIHLLIATQRPSVDVITGLIKANIPSRLAFAVSSLADSRVVLDQPGAERLIGKGDMLLLTASSSTPRRLQGPWVDEDDVRKVVAHWKRQSPASYVEGIEGQDGAAGAGGEEGEDDDDLLEAAMELVVRSQLGSTSMLQRKLRVGFARAGRLMDLLEQRGVVGPSEGSKARAVLMTVEELEGRREP
jgi:S-DNA-T family DNA segregation ATPase FtsK/SpoIIIE